MTRAIIHVWPVSQDAWRAHVSQPMAAGLLTDLHPDGSAALTAAQDALDEDAMPEEVSVRWLAAPAEYADTVYSAGHSPVEVDGAFHPVPPVDDGDAWPGPGDDGMGNEPPPGGVDE
jgi:hypothetical protein